MRRFTAAAAAAVLLALGAGTAPAGAAPQREQLIGMGLDSCAAPSLAQMSAFWKNSPYSAWGIYIGGMDRSCGQPNLTKAWVTSVTNQGWHLMPLWVGPQNPCAGGFDHFSTNTTTAYDQGKAEAVKAWNAMKALGMATNSPVTYDLEAPSSSTTTCINATKSFVRGWVAQLHVAPAQSAGVYTSSCSGFIDKFTTSPAPDFITGADWDGTPSTNSISCVSASHWSQHQRHKQYRGGHNETYNGVTINVDSDCSNGPTVALAPFTGNTACTAPAVAPNTVARQGNQVAEVMATDDGLQYRHSADGGRTWRSSALQVPVRTASVAMSADGSRASAMATLPGSAGGQPALFTGPAEGPLTARQAPVAGDVTWVGSRLVLAGGPQRSLLYTSADDGRTWQKLAGTTRFDVPADAPSHGAPLTTSDGVVVPVTLHGNASRVRLDVSTDGARFTPGVEVSLTGDAAPGVAVPVAPAGTAFVIADPAGPLHVVHGSTQETIVPAGLPGAIDALTFTDAQHGTAEVTIACQSKEDCGATAVTVTTADGGHTWS